MSDNAQAKIDQNIDPIATVELAAEIVSAFVSNNSVPVTGLADLILSVHAGLLGLSKPPARDRASVVKAAPAEIRKSITPDGLISFEDGKIYKTLKRHLTTRGLTPGDYRAKYGLPHDYPMTAPSYSAQRSTLARRIGLGRVGDRSGTQIANPADTVPEAGTAREGQRKIASTESAQKKRGKSGSAVKAK